MQQNCNDELPIFSWTRYSSANQISPRPLWGIQQRDPSVSRTSCRDLRREKTVVLVLNNDTHLKHLWLPSFACRNTFQAGLSRHHCNRQTTWTKMILKIEITCICDLIKSLNSSMKLQLITPLLRSWAEQSNSSRASTWKEKNPWTKSKISRWSPEPEAQARFSGVFLRS